jgi:ATP-dependent Clp protease ATP-binding subunit ClpA
MADRFDKFSERARRVLTLAQEEAQRFNHNYIGTEHLLLGLVREGEGVAAKVLANLGVELNKVRSAVEFIIGRGDRAVLGEIGLTPRAKKVIELAVDEARRLNHGYIGTEHLLLGLVREGEGIAAGVLESLGVKLERVRAETTRVLAQQQPGTPRGRQLDEAQEFQQRLQVSRSQPLEKQASAPDLSAVDAAPQTPDPLLELARMQARVADLQSQMRWQQAVERRRIQSRAEPTASPAVVLAREIVKALDALRQARTAAGTVGQRGYADGLHQIEGQLRALVAASATTLTPAAAAAGATPETKQAEPPASQEVLALRPLIELRRAAEATRRFRRAAALDTIVRRLEPLAFEEVEFASRAERLTLGASAAQHPGPFVGTGWETERLDRLFGHLRSAQLQALERDNEPRVLVLSEIIVALRSLPDEDGDDGEGVAIPAVPPPHPPFSARAEQRLDE